jgi:hypothetical protein
MSRDVETESGLDCREEPVAADATAAATSATGTAANMILRKTGTTRDAG